MTALIVDGDQGSLALFSHMVKAIPSVKPITGAEPFAVLAWCASNEPGLDGLELLQGLRALSGRKEIPVWRSLISRPISAPGRGQPRHGCWIAQ